METEKTIDMLSLMRWIVFLPAAVLAGFVAFNIAWYIHELVFGLFIGNGTLFGVSWIRFFSYLYMGVVTVYVACYVAPSSPQMVAAFTGGLILIVSGATIFYALSTSVYVGILDSVAMDLGAVGIAMTIYHGQTELV
jgi:hypothetical protein